MQLGFSKKITEILIDDFFEIVLDKLIENNKVKISNFGTFILKNKKERMGRNPKTKEKAIITQRNVITFKPTKEVKKYISNV